MSCVSGVVERRPARNRSFGVRVASVRPAHTKCSGVTFRLRWAYWIDGLEGADAVPAQDARLACIDHLQ